VNPTVPGKPSNPRWLICDTDSLLQLIAVDRLGPLKLLKSNYNVQAVITEAVETELRNMVTVPKFRDVKHILEKGLKSGLLPVLDESLLKSTHPKDAGAVLGRIDSRGEQFHRLGVGTGEAYTHAASVELNMPVLTNDRAALGVLERQGVVLQGTFLRSFDILVFGHQIGNLTDGDCDQARKSLAGRGEAVELCFSGCSFTAGLPKFYQRLIDGAIQPLGAAMPQKRYDRARLIIAAL
jgi:predicted nucleic acid-binding protein